MVIREDENLTQRMTNPYLEHPSEEALERFLLNRSEESEVEILETHVLACESCITRLETLESDLITLKTALVGRSGRADPERTESVAIVLEELVYPPKTLLGGSGLRCPGRRNARRAALGSQTATQLGQQRLSG